MAEQSGFFDAHLVNGVYDRVYLADNFAKYFASFIGNGIFGGKSNELMVQQKATASMSVRVLSGQGWINGYWYENTNEVSLTIDNADGVLNRIDLIVLRWDNSERVIRLAVKKGTPASVPFAPTLQRSADYYELKLAEITVNAGATKITQANILDTRLDTDVCGLVHAVVDQLDSSELGIQLDAFISEFIEENNTWIGNFKVTSAASINTFLSENQTKVNTLLSNGQTSIDNVASTGTTNINKLISDKTTEIDALKAELKQVISDNDAAAINAKIATFEADIAKLKLTAVESADYSGCYYRTVNEEVEWINSPNLFDTEYKTTERWNGKPVYQKVTYVAALSNKMAMSVHVDAAFDKIISITGFAVNSDDNMHYPFPIIIDGFEVVAAITGVVGDGGEGSDITINVNENLSAYKAYITVKYTKT